MDYGGVEKGDEGERDGLQRAAHMFRHFGIWMIQTFCKSRQWKLFHLGRLHRVRASSSFVQSERATAQERKPNKQQENIQYKDCYCSLIWQGGGEKSTVNFLCCSIFLEIS